MLEEKAGRVVETVNGLEAGVVVGALFEDGAAAFVGAGGDGDGGLEGVAGDDEGLGEELLDVEGVAIESIGDDGLRDGVGKVALRGTARDAEGAGGAGDGVTAGKLLDRLSGAMVLLNGLGRGGRHQGGR